MSSALNRRLARLEAAAPPPPEAPDVECYTWWDRLPPAVIAYIQALPEEVRHDPRLRPKPIRGNERELGYSRIFHAGPPGLAVLDELLVRRWDDRPITLTEVQDIILIHAWLQMHRHLSPGGCDGRTMRAAYRRMMDAVLDPTEHPCWLNLPLTQPCTHPQGERRAGQTRPQHWRLTRTHDPADLAVMGLGPAELALLEADE